MSKFDTVALLTLHNRLVNICEEMALVMMKTAYSTIFSEGLDFCCVILNKDAEIIAETEYTPSMIGAITHTAKWTIEEMGMDNIAPGDVIIHNDSYRGGCHLPEHMIMKPVFLDGELFGFVGNMGHVAEIGGKAPGSFAADATDIYQEGLRLPPIKLMEKGEYVKDVWKMIMTNHRTPYNTWGDFHAMIGSLQVAEKRLAGLVERYGREYIEEGSRLLMDYSARRLRAEIEEIPDGTYHAINWLEDDGVSAEMIQIEVTVTVRGDEVIVDFTGSSPQVKGPINCTWVVSASVVYIAILSLTDPYIPRNSGAFRPIKIIAPPGTVVNVQHPGPCVAGNTDSQIKLIDLILSALSQAIPRKITAGSGGSSSNFLIGGVHPDTGQYYSNYSFDGQGTGGTAFKDGNDAEIPRHGNCRNSPIEVFEGRYSLLTLEYKLVNDSGGPGRNRGGLGISRIYEVTAPEVTISALFDRFKIKPWGLFGGKEGTNSSLTIKKKGDNRWRTFAEVYGRPSASKFTNAVVTKGDLIHIVTPGGGGFGDPLDRNPELVLEDVKEGYVSLESAKRDYGVVIVKTNKMYQINQEATRAERERLRAARPEPIPLYDWWPKEGESINVVREQLIGRRSRSG
ncbi:MAG: hydantoinase B/oxoprolinase family protein [Spirochaetota bacterium]|nr:MAG: hydantoinase B/oxoprolinase family protein [Spirochaetota bacterium]